MKVILKYQTLLLFSTVLMSHVGCQAAEEESVPVQHSTLDLLPEDVMNEIGTYLQPKDIRTFGLTSKGSARQEKSLAAGYARSDNVAVFDFSNPNDIQRLKWETQIQRFPGQPFRIKVQGITEENIEALLEFCHNVTELDLNNAQIRDRGVTLLASHPHVANLISLNLSYTGIGVDGLRAIVTSSMLAKLTSLNLRGTRLNMAMIALLGGSKSLPNLRHLNVSVNGLDVNKVKALITSSIAAQLESLDLSGNHRYFKDAGMSAFLDDAVNLNNLKVLNLSSNRIGPEGLKYLLNSKVAATLTALGLKQNMIKEEGVEMLDSSELVKHLEFLDISFNVISLGTVENISDYPKLSAIPELIFSQKGSQK